MCSSINRFEQVPQIIIIFMHTYDNEKMQSQILFGGMGALVHIKRRVGIVAILYQSTN